MNKLALLALSSAALAACSDDGTAENENEVITTVILTFTPPTGTAVTATFDDPDGDGGAAPTVDPIQLPAGSYALAVRFQNRLASPAEEITDEVLAERDFHLVLFTGTAVVGPASATATGPLTQSYRDSDDHGFPVGLADAIAARPGTGQLTVTLRHMPPEEPPVKAGDTVDLVKAHGVDAIGGSTDAQVSFAVTVP